MCVSARVCDICQWHTHTHTHMHTHRENWNYHLLITFTKISLLTKGLISSFRQTVCSRSSSLTPNHWERSSSVVECLIRGRGAAGSSLTGVTALCPWARHINPSLVLVQPRKTRPYITERLLMGRKKSNQTNKNFKTFLYCIIFCATF